MAVEISNYVKRLSGELDDNAFEVSDSLGRIGSEEVITEMVKLLDSPNSESRHMAARTLALVQNNDSALEPLLESIQRKENSGQTGDLMAALEGFDVSSKYVEIFKLYLFGSFKVSMIAKDLLDYKEFDITSRVLKKATKHWNHYTNNVKQDDAYELKKIEVDEMFDDMRTYING